MDIARQDLNWQFNLKQNRLEVFSGDAFCYATGLRQSQLSGDALQRQPFGIDDLDFLHASYELLTEQCGMDESNGMLHAMNAVSARRFFKPIMPQSWYFLPSSARLTLSELILVELDTPEDSGLFLILDQDDSAALVMLVSESLTLTEHKTMTRGSVIRVMEDRIARYASNSSILHDQHLRRA